MEKMASKSARPHAKQTASQPQSTAIVRSRKQNSIQTPLTVAPTRWKIDEQLDSLIGHPVRVGAEAFAPIGADGNATRIISITDLILPDNTRTEGLPVFFEGVLLQAARQVGVVHVRLGKLSNAHASTEGRVPFRGGLAIILHGPAIVRLAIPFQVQKLPPSERNYFEDLRFPKAQFFLPLESD